MHYNGIFGLTKNKFADQDESKKRIGVHKML